MEKLSVVGTRHAKTCLLGLAASLALVACGGGGAHDTAAGPGSGTGGNTIPTPPPPLPPPSSSTAGSWPASAQSDPAVQGKEPSLPATVCATVNATLRKNTRGLLDDAVDAPPANSQPDTARIQAAINACPAGQAVKLVVGSQGENAFLSGPIALAGTVTLWVDKGVTLFASRKPSDFQIAGKNNCGEGASSDNGCSALITTTPNNNGVVGEGVIDGRGGAVLTSGLYANKLTWWDVGALTKTMSNFSQNNPRLIQVNNGSNFSLYRITLQNAPKFHVVSSGTNGFTAWGTKLLTPSLEYSVAGYKCPGNSTPVVSGAPNLTTPSTCFTPATVKNTDGIDPGQSQNILLAFNHISTGDDGVALKSHNSTTGPMTNVQILHNRFYFTHGMSLGSETDSGMNGITIRDLALDGFDMNATTGFRIKTDDSRGGEVQNVLVDGMCVRRVQQPIVMDAYYGDASDSANKKFPNIHNVTIKNFRYLDVAGSIYNGASAQLLFRGYQSQGQFNFLYGITLDNVIFDSLPGWVNTKLAMPIPSYAELTMGPGPVSFASLLQGVKGANQVRLFDLRSTTPAPYDCSAAFVDFPAANAPMSIH
ncbi:glycoside hydrolase family 28 protein [Massilia horti]|uniref:Polygalacturonase n=1 Tax=Massilia horti TaxID=2562153 RepID=A0A4Y9SX93_9BURK|nr:glycosyl hydrolase family 28 protein [Massilia horti]TFW31314.1 polygalacturonase [Massilia horti]